MLRIAGMRIATVAALPRNDTELFGFRAEIDAYRHETSVIARAVRPVAIRFPCIRRMLLP